MDEMLDDPDQPKVVQLVRHSQVLTEDAWKRQRVQEIEDC